jgi:hypothetical protein
MNLAEFKAWFEGYTEGMRDTPSAKQWARIKARVDEITAQPTEVRYFYDHYWRPHYYSLGVAGGMSNAATLTTTGYCQTVGQNSASAYALTSTDAFRMLGQADAHSEAA